jgi:hypothetical protein
MFPFDPLWVYIAVPAVLISILVLIKLKQEKTAKRVEDASMVEEREEANPLEKETAGDSLEDVRETQEKPESSEKTKPQDCPYYLGYLYMQKAPDRTHIPSECYSCQKLLQCLYSPHVMEKVYGE